MYLDKFGPKLGGNPMDFSPLRTFDALEAMGDVVIQLQAPGLTG